MPSHASPATNRLINILETLHTHCRVFVGIYNFPGLCPGANLCGSGEAEQGKRQLLIRPYRVLAKCEVFQGAKLGQYVAVLFLERS